MGKVRKTEFVPWQKYEGDHTFMFQGLLLLCSALLSVSSYFIVLFLILRADDLIIQSFIANGKIIYTVRGPILWSAIILTTFILILILMSDIMKLLFAAWVKPTKDDDVEALTMKPERIVMNVRSMMITQCAFYAFVYLAWLYSSVVFSFLFLNGVVKYSVIFLSLTCLSFFAKKLICLPIFMKMMQSEEREKEKRSGKYLTLELSEGVTVPETNTREITSSRYPALYALVNECASELHMKVERAEAVLGEKIIVKHTRGKMLKLRIGVSAVSMFSEEELRAKLMFEIMKQKNYCLREIRNFVLLNKAVNFSVSSWNPLERVYKPLAVMASGTIALLPFYVASVETNFFDRFERKTDRKTAYQVVSAECKLWIYANHTFARREGISAKRFAEKSPDRFYHDKLMAAFFDYIEKKEDDLIELFGSVNEDLLPVYPSKNKRLIDAAKSGELNLKKRSDGDLAADSRRLSSEFGIIYRNCMSIGYSAHKKLFFDEPRERLRAFECERLDGKRQSDIEILSAVNDYITLAMPKNALSLCSELQNKESLHARAARGASLLLCGDIEGLQLLIDAGKEDARIMYCANNIIDSASVFLKDGKKLAQIVLDSQEACAKYMKGRIPAYKLWILDDITGEYKLTPECKKSNLDDKDKKKLTEKIIAVSGDRFEWAAAVSYDNGRIKKELVVVRCSKLTDGMYTDSFIDGVYFDDLDLLQKNLKAIGDFGDIDVLVDDYPGAPIEAFLPHRGMIIAHRGKIEAENFLRAEAGRQRRGTVDSDFDGFEDNGTDE